MLAACLEATVTLGVYCWALDARGLAEARGLAFSVLVFAELFRSFAARSTTRVFWEVGALGNLKLVGVIAISTVLQLAIHHIPWTQSLFDIGSIAPIDYALALVLGLVPVTVLELWKLIRKLPWT